MRKPSIVLLNAILFSLLPATNLFALSDEANAVIEAMRAHLREAKAAEKVKEEKTANVYVPGKELSEALVRYKTKVYSNLKPKMEVAGEKPVILEETDNTVTAEEVEENTHQVNDSEVSYIEPVEAYEQYPITASDFPEITDVEVAIAHGTAEISDTPSEQTITDTENNTPELTEESHEYIPGRLLMASILKIRHAQRRDTPASEELDEAIEEYEARLANSRKETNSATVMQKADEEISALYIPQNAPSELVIENNKEENDDENIIEPELLKETTNQSKQIDDEKFNDYISKYDFEMPENYRIIVE